MNNRIRLSSDDGKMELEILEETRLQGVSYILVTDAAENEDGMCYVMKDVSDALSEEADYIFPEDEEAEAVMKIFSAMLEGEGISIEQ